MAGSPTIPPDLQATGGMLLPYSCRQCLVAILVLGLATAVFMVICLSLSFKLARTSMRSPRVAATTPVPLELWASPPTSQSQTNLLWTTEPVLSPPPPFPIEWEEEAAARQPRVTLHDIGEFWWRSTARAV